MNEKKRNICSIVGIILSVVGINNYLFAMRVLFAGVAAVAYAIKLGIEIANDEGIGNSIFLIAICLFDIIISAMQIVA